MGENLKDSYLLFDTNFATLQRETKEVEIVVLVNETFYQHQQIRDLDVRSISNIYSPSIFKGHDWALCCCGTDACLYTN